MKKLLLSISLLAMSFSSLAVDITESELQGYMKALPAVVDWSKNQDSLKSMDLGNMLGGSEGGTNATALGALGMIKDNDLYKEFTALTTKYGFTPEQLIAVGSEVSMAYLENIKGNLSPENKETVNQLMGGLQSMSGSQNNSANSMLGSVANSANAASAAAPVVSENNVNLVKEYMPQLQKLFAMVQ
ncbi:MAG TPA: short-chain dehydrogenase [Pseudoalteromonas prydzensis]|uniref:Short-chain dehydrogenase n=1 Tax=Pseudoalteromonas prydzensis TaxID=182141 RepID=A0A7V1CYE8_9GAMM|nr:short-chain dehydrogenase [Pseudoalteromonas prydzensis]HEA16607.1 short-chain dehydrogenase [Pseudoalteromonas prydzensis]